MTSFPIWVLVTFFETELSKQLGPVSTRNFREKFRSFFHNFLGGDTNFPFRQKMRKICIKNIRQIFRNISEMCVGKFRNFRWHFYVSTKNIPNCDNFRENYGKLCWKKVSKLFDISCSIIFHNLLPLRCEEIFHVLGTLDQTCQKNGCL